MNGSKSDPGAPSLLHSYEHNSTNGCVYNSYSEGVNLDQETNHEEVSTMPTPPYNTPVAFGAWTRTFTQFHPTIILEIGVIPAPPFVHHVAVINGIL